MANMGHCRFTNTLADLRDCLDHMEDPPQTAENDRGLSPEEVEAKARLIALCNTIAADYSPDYGDGDE